MDFSFSLLYLLWWIAFRTRFKSLLFCLFQCNFMVTFRQITASGRMIFCPRICHMYHNAAVILICYDILLSRRYIRLYLCFIIVLTVLCQPAVSSCIINCNPRLHIITINMKPNSSSFVLHRFRFYTDSACHQIVPFK